MRRNKVWTAAQPPSSVAGITGQQASARVWVREESTDAPPTARVFSQPLSAAQRSGVGLGLACTAAVLAAAGAKPSSQAAAVRSVPRLGEGVFLASPHKLVRAGNAYAQAEPARTHDSAAAPAAAVTVMASRPQPLAQRNHLAAEPNIVGGKRAAGKTWMRTEGAHTVVDDAAEPRFQAAAAAAPTAALQDSHLPAPAAARHNQAVSVPRPVSRKQQPASKTWVRPDSVRQQPGRAQAVQWALSASATPTAMQSGRPRELPLQPRLPAKKVWTRGDSRDQPSVAPSSDSTDTRTERTSGEERRSLKGSIAASPAKSMPRLSAPQAGRTQRSGAPSQPLLTTGAEARRPRSLTWRNPALDAAEAGPATSASALPTARRTVAATAAPAMVAQSAATGSLGGAVPHAPGKTPARARRLPAGARASALGRVVHGGVVKPRSNRLQRIGEHLYRAHSGAGGRTLQRQGATPTYNTRPAKRVVRASRVASGRPAPAALARNSAAAAPGAKRSGAGGRSGKAAEPTVFCPSFCRTGKCRRRAEGRCKYVHDASKVAVCPGWLTGQCKEAACLLQHAHAAALMPVCTFFLQGLCSNTQCPYLHVNLDASAPVCEAFLRGYCAAGPACRSKHLTMRMVRDLRAKRTLKAGAATDRAVKKPKVSRPQRYFTNAGNADGTEAAAIAANAQEQPQQHLRPVDSGDEDGLDSDDEDPAASPRQERFSSPWPEFIHLPEDTDSE